jgi:Glycosyltransferase family 87
MDSSALAPTSQPVSKTKPSRKLGLALVLLSAVLAWVSTWFYMDYILRPQQIAESAAHNRPRGNLSDLYPRWLGARELLLHQRNPYSTEMTREIQHGYYGRPLDPMRPEDPKDQQGFAYPVYVIFLLAPTAKLPFGQVEAGFRWFLIAFAPLSLLLWLRVVRWKISPTYSLALALFALGWLPMVQGIKLQQLSLLVAGFLAACAACLTGGWLLLAGGLLALATIKPQLTWPLVLWLLVWAASDWRARKRFVFGFAIMMMLLLAGAELILPGWVRMFIDAIGQYHRYTQNESVLVWMFGAIAGRILEILCGLACAVLVGRSRREAASGAEFGRSTALVLALTVAIVPMFAPYNQVLLIPAIFVLLKAATSRNPLLPAFRLAGAVGLLVLIWPWIATIVLTFLYPWMTSSLRDHLWSMPFYSNFMLPIFIFGLATLDRWMHAASSLREPFAAE